jgi:hypothetical protein
VGCQMILLGLTKKLLIADQLAIFVDPVFAEAGTYSPLTVWSAVIAYSLQIYCDFSGYSDMAIGISKIIGIDLPENFNMPYLAVSPLDFWRRWHITLSSWLRDYLYFSLPQRRNRPWDKYRNTAITFLLSGLWHGAGWTFVCWGALHGVALSGSQWWAARRLRLGRQPSQSMGVRLVCWLSTYLFICVTWVLFRSQSLPAILTMLRKNDRPGSRGDRLALFAINDGATTHNCRTRCWSSRSAAIDCHSSRTMEPAARATSVVHLRLWYMVSDQGQPIVRCLCPFAAHSSGRLHSWNLGARHAALLCHRILSVYLFSVLTAAFRSTLLRLGPAGLPRVTPAYGYK